MKENRFRSIGIAHQKILFVSYTVRGEAPEICRIISARDATNEEREIYEQERIASGFDFGK